MDRGWIVHVDSNFSFLMAKYVFTSFKIIHVPMNFGT